MAESINHARFCNRALLNMIHDNSCVFHFDYDERAPLSAHVDLPDYVEDRATIDSEATRLRALFTASHEAGAFGTKPKLGNYIKAISIDQFKLDSGEYCCSACQETAEKLLAAHSAGQEAFKRAKRSADPKEVLEALAKTKHSLFTALPPKDRAVLLSYDTLDAFSPKSFRKPSEKRVAGPGATPSTNPYKATPPASTGARFAPRPAESSEAEERFCDSALVRIVKAQMIQAEAGGHFVSAAGAFGLDAAAPDEENARRIRRLLPELGHHLTALSIDHFSRVVTPKTKSKRAEQVWCCDTCKMQFKKLDERVLRATPSSREAGGFLWEALPEADRVHLRPGQFKALVQFEGKSHLSQERERKADVKAKIAAQLEAAAREGNDARTHYLAEILAKMS